MSLATFKKKTNATYKNHTVNNQKQLVLYSKVTCCDNKQNVFTEPTSAFTINGNVRNRSYIGKSYRMSNTPSNIS